MKKRTLVILVMMVSCFSAGNAQQVSKKIIKTGQFVNIKSANGKEYRIFAAGPEKSKSAILFVHDYFGISKTTKESVERLGAMGYRTIAVDLYEGRSATTGDSVNLKFSDVRVE